MWGFQEDQEDQEDQAGTASRTEVKGFGSASFAAKGLLPLPFSLFIFTMTP